MLLVKCCRVASVSPEGPEHRELVYCDGASEMIRLLSDKFRFDF